MIVLQTTYARLLYSTVLNPPDSCVRPVTGTVNYMAMGWSVNYESVGFLIPMTIVNLASLAVLIVAMRVSAKSGGSTFNPLKPGALLLLTTVHHDGDEKEKEEEKEKEVPSNVNEWEHTVKFRTKVCDFQRMMGLIVETIWPPQLLKKETSTFAKDHLSKLMDAATNFFSSIFSYVTGAV